MIFYLAWFIELRRGPEAWREQSDAHAPPRWAPVLMMVGLVLPNRTWAPPCMISLIAFAMLFVAGLSLKYVGGAVRPRLPVIYLLIVRVPYRLAARADILLTGADPQGHGFQLLQSLIAVGSGGFSGVGLMESRQKLFFLPEAHTDFIFSIICEEFGFIGAVIVLALFAVYGWRGFVAAMKAPDDFGRLLGVGNHDDGRGPGADQFERRAGACCRRKAFRCRSSATAARACWACYWQRACF